MSTIERIPHLRTVVLLLAAGCATGNPAPEVGVPIDDPSVPATPSDRNIVAPVATTSLLPYVQSGDRLTALAYEAPGGVLHLDAFYDELLQVRCDFTQTEGGGWHCLPEFEGFYVAYDDATCSRSYVEGSAQPAAAGTSAWVSTDGECGEGFTAPFELQAPFSLEGESVFTPANGSCEQSDSSFGATSVWQATPIPLSTFVEAEPHLAPHGDAYALVLVGSDGARVSIGAATIDGTRCVPRETTAGSRCLPWTGAIALDGSYYADATCSDAVGFMANPSCDRPYAMVNDGGIWSAHPLDAATGDDVYQLDGSSCDLQTESPMPGSAAFTLGQAPPSDSWPAVQPVLEGSGGITQGWLQATDGTRLGPNPRYDHLQIDGETCEVVGYGDHVVCVPGYQTVADARRFADAACTQPLSAASGEMMLAWADVDARPRQLQAAWVGGAAFDGPVFTFDDEGACEPTSLQAYERVPYEPPVLTPVTL